MFLTAYDKWFRENGIRSGQWFIEDIKRLGETDPKFKEVADYLTKLENTPVDIEEGIESVEEFRSRMVYYYNFGFIPSFYDLYSTLDVNDTDEEQEKVKNDDAECINRIYIEYKKDYKRFVKKVRNLVNATMGIECDNNKKENNIVFKNSKLKYSKDDLEKLRKMIFR